MSPQILTFDEPVIADSLNCSAISLRSSPASDAEEVRLSENCANGNGNMNRLVLKLWHQDMSEIRMQASLGRSAGTTYMVRLMRGSHLGGGMCPNFYMALAGGGRWAGVGYVWQLHVQHWQPFGQRLAFHGRSAGVDLQP